MTSFVGDERCDDSGTSPSSEGHQHWLVSGRPIKELPRKSHLSSGRRICPLPTSVAVRSQAQTAAYTGTGSVTSGSSQDSSGSHAADSSSKTSSVDLSTASSYTSPASPSLHGTALSRFPLLDPYTLGTAKPLQTPYSDSAKFSFQSFPFAGRHSDGLSGAYNLVQKTESEGEDEAADYTYVDWLENSGNTKKRKSARSSSAQGPDGGLGGDGSTCSRDGHEDCSECGGFCDSSCRDEGVPEPPRSLDAPAAAKATSLPRRAHVSEGQRRLAAHRSIVRARLSRRRMDSTAALVASEQERRAEAEQRVRTKPRLSKSERKQQAATRAYLAHKEALAAASKPKAAPSKDEAKPSVQCPSGEFTFVCSSPTADRVKALEVEVAALQQRLKNEAKESGGSVKLVNGIDQVSSAGARQGERAGVVTGLKAEQAGQAGQAGGAGKNGGGPPPPPKLSRRKKATMNNVHHRANYTPSRLPSEPAHHHDANGHSSAAPGLDHPTTTCSLFPDEWCCIFCEYELFYGEPSLLLRAIKNRKKVVNRRKRASERAAKAAAGGGLLESKVHDDEEGCSAEGDADRRDPTESATPLPAGKLKGKKKKPPVVPPDGIGFSPSSTPSPAKVKGKKKRNPERCSCGAVLSSSESKEAAANGDTASANGHASGEESAARDGTNKRGEAIPGEHSSWTSETDGRSRPSGKDRPSAPPVSATSHSTSSENPGDVQAQPD